MTFRLRPLNATNSAVVICGICIVIWHVLAWFVEPYAMADYLVHVFKTTPEAEVHNALSRAVQTLTRRDAIISITLAFVIMTCAILQVRPTSHYGDDNLSNDDGMTERTISK